MPRFLNALGFLTRLGPSRGLDPNQAAGSLAAFPLVGLVLGLILTAVPALGLFSGHSQVQAWIMVLAGVWLTRGLHLDGVADLCDAVGAVLDPARFWTILKDSRTGAFGALGLILALTGQRAALSGLIEGRAYGALIFAPILGRTAAVLLGTFSRDLLRPGLGQFFMQIVPEQTLALVLGQTVLLGLFLVPVKAQITAWALMAAGLAVLLRLGRRVNGINGDFLGAAIVWGEMAAALACLAWL